MFLNKFVKLENCSPEGIIVSYLKGIYVKPEEIEFISVFNYGTANHCSTRQDSYIYHMKSGEMFRATAEQHERNLAKIEDFYKYKGLDLE